MPTTHSVDVQLNLLTATLQSSLGQIRQQLGGMQQQAGAVGRSIRGALAFGLMERFGRATDQVFSKIIDRAATFETAMTKVGIATNTSGAALKDLGDLVMKTSSLHLTNVTDAANMMAQMARSGMSLPVLRAMTEPIAQFADVERQERGMGFEESTTLAVQIGRLFGAKTQQESQRVLDNLFKAMNATPIAPGVLATSIKNFAPIGQKLGMSQESTFQMAALMGTMGLGSRGGTEFADILIRQAGGTTSRSGFGRRGNQQKSALEDLGVVKGGKNIAFQGGKFDVVTWMNQLLASGEKLKSDPGRFVRDLTEAYGRIGVKLAAAITPNTIENLREMMGAWDKAIKLQDAESRILGTLQAQETVFGTNLDNLATTIGTGAVPALTGFNKSLADGTTKISDYLKQHETLAKVLGFGAVGGKVVGMGLELAGKAGLAWISLQAARGSIPVRVIGGGLPGGGGSPPGGSNWLKQAGGAAVGAAKWVGRAVGVEGAVAGLGVMAVAEGAYALSKSPQAMANVRSSTFDALKLQEQTRQNTVEQAAAGTGAHVLTPADAEKLAKLFPDTVVNVALDGHLLMSKRIRHAGNRTSGQSGTTPSHSPSSGFGSGGSP